MLQAETIGLLTANLKATDMLTVYYSDYKGQKNHGVYCALVPSNKTNKYFLEILGVLVMSVGFQVLLNIMMAIAK